MTGFGFIPPQDPRHVNVWGRCKEYPEPHVHRDLHHHHLPPLPLALAWGQAHEEAAAKGEGCAVLDGSLVERLHAENARRVIELHESIAALEAGQESGV